MGASTATVEGSHWNGRERAMRRVFGVVNKYWSVPVLRSGLGPLWVTPFGGYVMLLRTTGRKSGLPRYAPLNYAIRDGFVYCIAGFGSEAHWYRNLLADPRVEVVLPSMAFAGIAETVTDPDEALAATRDVLLAAGFAGWFIGSNPRTITDEALRAFAMPVVRVRFTGIGSGPSDPRGLLWIVVQVVSGVWLLSKVRSLLRRR